MRTTIRDNYTPELGQYHEQILVDPTRRKTWLFDCDGVFTDITKVTVVSERGDSEEYAASQEWLTRELEALEAADEALQDNIDAEAATREADDKTLQDNIDNEEADRIAADTEIWDEIEAIEAASDVVDIVGTYEELEDYDTSALKDNDIIKVLQDETHDDAIAYYRWNDSSDEFVFVGVEGPYYTASETDTLLAGKVDKTDVTSTPSFNPPAASETLVMSQKGVAKQVLNENNGGVQISSAAGNASVGSPTAIAIGPSATAGSTPATAIGMNSTASGTCALALGYSSNASGDNSISLAVSGGKAAGARDIAIGNVSTEVDAGETQTADNLIIGSSSSLTSKPKAIGGNSTAIGHGAITASGSGSTAMGFYNVTASGQNSTAIGTSTITASGQNSTAVGSNGITAAGTNDVVIGSSGTSTAVYSGTQTASNIAVGNNGTRSNGGNAAAFGNSGVTASGQNSTAVGNSGTTASGANSTAVGYGARATGGNAAAFGASSSGANVTASGANSIALGSSGVESAGAYSTAVGVSGVFASGTSTVALGTQGVSVSSTASFSAAIGCSGVSAYGQYNMAVGCSGVNVGQNGSTATNYNFAFGGYGVTANGGNSVAIGTSNVNATAARTVALGHRSCTASHADSVALGTDAATGRTFEVSLGKNAAGSTPEVTKYIAHVTAGVNDTDAVNVKQMNDAIAAAGGGGSQNVWYATSAGGGYALLTATTVSGSAPFVLSTGAIVFVKFTDASQGTLGLRRLKIDNTNEAYIDSNSGFVAHETVCFVYDGTLWRVVGKTRASTGYYGEVKLASNYTDNTSDTVPTSAHLYSVYTIANGKQDALTAGAGINIDANNEISVVTNNINSTDWNALWQ